MTDLTTHQGEDEDFAGFLRDQIAKGGPMSGLAASLLDAVDRHRNGIVLHDVTAQLKESPFSSKLAGLTFKADDCVPDVLAITPSSGFVRLGTKDGVVVYDKSKLRFAPSSVEVMELVSYFLKEPALAHLVTLERADQHDPEGNRITIQTAEPDKAIKALRDFSERFTGIIFNIKMENKMENKVEDHYGEMLAETQGGGFASAVKNTPEAHVLFLTDPKGKETDYRITKPEDGLVREVILTAPAKLNVELVGSKESKFTIDQFRLAAMEAVWEALSIDGPLRAKFDDGAAMIVDANDTGRFSTVVVRAPNGHGKVFSINFAPGSGQ